MPSYKRLKRIRVNFFNFLERDFWCIMWETHKWNPTIASIVLMTTPWIWIERSFFCDIIYDILMLETCQYFIVIVFFLLSRTVAKQLYSLNAEGEEFSISSIFQLNLWWICLRRCIFRRENTPHFSYKNFLAKICSMNLFLTCLRVL